MVDLHFLFGVAPRSGTTYLGDLLAAHPAVELPRDLPEDGLLQPLHHLDAYVEDLAKFWESWPDLATPGPNDVMQAVGRGFQNLVLERSSKDAVDVVVSKTPFPTNLDRLRELFPESRAIVIVRDGRSVVESTVRTWGSPFDVAAARFRDGAREILRAIGSVESAPPHLHVVSYESLFADPVGVTSRALEFLGLDSSLLPADAVEGAPVRGSSTARGDESGDAVHWDAVERPADFAPTTRWNSWTDRQHELFAAIAGDENVALGYGANKVGGLARSSSALLSLRRAAFTVLPDSARDSFRRR